MGCAEPSTEHGDWGGVIDTLPSGTVVVQNGDAQVWSEGAGWNLTEELRIGSVLEDGPATFGDVRDLAVDDQGRIHVLDSQALEIRVFDTDGRYLYRVGRSGEGPGEFKDPVAMGWTPDGRLRVVDLGNARISTFGEDGEFLGDVSQAGGFGVYPWPGVFQQKGGVVTIAFRVGEDGVEPIFVRLDDALVPVDSMPMPRFGGDPEFFATSDGGMRASIPYAAGMAWDLDPLLNLWVAENTKDYQIVKVSAEGDTVLKTERSYHPTPVTRAEIDSAIASLSWFTNQGGRVDRSRFPAHKPALNGLFVEGDYLFVRPSTEEFGSGYGDRTSVIDVFELSGRYLGRMNLPEGFQDARPQPRIVGDRLYAVVRDELDVSYVVRYRIR